MVKQMGLVASVLITVSLAFGEPPRIERYKADGAGAGASVGGTSGSFTITLDQLTGFAGMAYITANYYRCDTPECLSGVGIFADGYIPSDLLKASSQSISLSVADLRTFPHMNVSLLRVWEGGYEWLPPTEPVPLQVTFRATNVWETESTGTTRTRWRQPDGYVLIKTEVGYRRDGSGSIEGVYAGIPLAIPDAQYNSVAFRFSRGNSITIERIPQ